jgi:hypothetical protein
MQAGFPFFGPFGSDRRHMRLLLRSQVAGQLAQSGQVAQGYHCIAVGLAEATLGCVAGDPDGVRLVQSYHRLLNHYSQSYRFPWS